MVLRNIEAERIRKGIDKEKMATSAGVSLKTYYNWINGVIPIPSTALINMAELLETSIDYLLGRTEKTNFTASADKPQQEVKHEI